jgi:hypothetical protein
LRERNALSPSRFLVARTATTAAVSTTAAATTTVAATAAAAVSTAAAATTTVAATTATAAATTTTTEPATAAGTAAEAAATGGLGDRFVDAQIATANSTAVECTDCGLSLFIRAHLDEAETHRTTAFAVHDDLCGYNATVLRT